MHLKQAFYLFLLVILGCSITNTFARSINNSANNQIKCKPGPGTKYVEYYKEQFRAMYGDDYEDRRVMLCHDAAKAFPSAEFKKPSLNDPLVVYNASKHAHKNWPGMNKEVEDFCIGMKEHSFLSFMPLIDFDKYFNNNTYYYKGKNYEMLQVNIGEDFNELRTNWLNKYIEYKKSITDELVDYNKRNNVKLIQPVYDNECKLISKARPIRHIQPNTDEMGSVDITDDFSVEELAQIRSEGWARAEAEAEALAKKKAENELTDERKGLDKPQQQVDEIKKKPQQNTQNPVNPPIVVQAPVDTEVKTDQEQVPVSNVEDTVEVDRTQEKPGNPLKPDNAGDGSVNDINLKGEILNINNTKAKNDDKTKKNLVEGSKSGSGRLNNQAMPIVAASAILLSAVSQLRG